MTRQALWQQRRRAAGCCITCGQPRGANGTSYQCRACCDKRAARVKRAYYSKKIETAARSVTAEAPTDRANVAITADRYDLQRLGKILGEENQDKDRMDIEDRNTVRES